MKICAGIVEFGDPEGLDRLLQTLGLGQGGLDGAIVVHRKYDHFDLNETNKTFLQDTLKVASKYPNVFVDHSLERIEQVQARNIYMQRAGELGYDWLLVLDSDEYLLPNPDWKRFRTEIEYIDSFKAEHQIFDVMMEGSLSDRGPRPRLFKDPSTITYWKRHYWWVLNKSNRLLRGVGDAERIISGVYIRHSKIVRTPEHLHASLAYYDWQEIIERPDERKEVDDAVKEIVTKEPIPFGYAPQIGSSNQA